MSDPRYPQRPVLLVDDESHILFGMSSALKMDGIDNVITCDDPRRVSAIMSERPVEVLLLDLMMPHLRGEVILEEVAEQHPEVPVIVVTGVDDAETAVGCMKRGAYDYLVKPVEETRLVTTVRRALEHRELQSEVLGLKRQVLKGRLESPEAFAEVVTQDAALLGVFHYITAVAPSSQPVLITGETGVGKDLMARAVHTASARQGEFVRVNAAGLDDQVFADTLFGHVKGAFTGADRARAGLVERAAGGTLFLDEIGDLSPASQVKLLGLLQEREYLPLGQDKPRRSDARVVVATNQDLAQGMAEGRFRKDLYYRLVAHQVVVPPLRERTGDLGLLVDHFLAEAAADLGRPKPTPPPELINLLATYHFPGNIRELRAMVFDAVSRHRAKVLSLESFKAHIQRERGGAEVAAQPAGAGGDGFLAGLPVLPTIKQMGELLVAEALRRSGGNLSAAAQQLGVTRQALSKRLKKAADSD